MTNGDQKNGLLTYRRQAGVLLHIAALPGTYGIGELGSAAHRFVDTLVEMKIGVWQFLPVGPTGYGDSPYQSFSTFAGNEMLIDIGNILELGMLTQVDVEDLVSLPKENVDYDNLVPIKRRLLNEAARRFRTCVGNEVLEEFDAFKARHDAEWLHDYALFRVVKSLQDERPWPEWPDEYVHRDQDALVALEEADAQAIETVKILQFLFFRQWAQLRNYAHQNGILLFGDMPIYIALDSSDAWANRDILRLDGDGRAEAVAGVPPDYFSEDGQLWGNPLYDWEEHAADGYTWWIRRLQATTELVDIVRIDHFRGFESYWAVPADAETARVGRWEPGPGDAIFRAMRDAIGQLPIVAEDLGVITPEVDKLRDDNELPGMCVLQFAVKDTDFQLAGVRENSVCYTGTHDNDTTMAWYQSDGVNTDYGDLIKVALETNARLAVVPIQDFLHLGSEARYNVPGIAAGNWRWRVQDAQLSAEFCHNVASMVDASGRGMSLDERTE